MSQVPAYDVEFTIHPSEGAPYLAAYDSARTAREVYASIKGYDNHERFVDLSGDPADAYFFVKDDEKHVLTVFVNVGPMRDVTLNV